MLNIQDSHKSIVIDCNRNSREQVSCLNKNLLPFPLIDIDDHVKV